jgi:hypothetical protein
MLYFSNITTMLPLFFTQSKKFSELIYKGDKYEFLGNTPNLGRRIKFLGVTLDLFFCEEEPKVEPAKGLHVITWHVPKNKDVYENIKKEGWYGPFGKYMSSTYPAAFINVQKEEYYKSWSKDKQNHRKKWLEMLADNTLEISSCDLDTFLLHYLNSDLPVSVKNMNQKQMKTLSDIYKEDMLFYLIKHVHLSKIVAGVCILHENEIKQSTHQYCFSDKNYKYLGVGLVDFCILDAKKHNFRYLSLTILKTPSVTRFKLLFNPIVLYFRQTYFKVIYNR